MILQADVALGCKVSHFSPGFGKPVDDLFSVELNDQLSALEGYFQVVPLTAQSPGLQQWRLGIINRSRPVDSFARIVNLNFERMVDVIVAYRNEGDPEKDAGIGIFLGAQVIQFENEIFEFFGAIPE